MKRCLGLIFLFSSFVVQPLVAQAGSEKSSLSGKWIATIDFFGSPLYLKIDLDQLGDKLTGKFGGDALEGTINGDQYHFLAKDTHGGSEEATGRLENEVLHGDVVETSGEDPSHPFRYTFTAALILPRAATAPQRHEFTPTIFYRQFSPSNKPVLRINPGDTVHTTTVDAGGVDAKDVRRVLGGNPQTGPFYVETAMPGDTLVVHIDRLRLNRDWAGSDDNLVERSTDSRLAVTVRDNGKNIKWHLDPVAGVASPAQPSEHLVKYTIPLRPMLGCVATAVGPSAAPPPTGDSGAYGGNMDFNEIVEGATVYLPVFNPGALLYFGDGHAAQGDGELNGNALETSMDVEVTVDVIPGKRPPLPRVENATTIIATGIDGSLDDAFRAATSNMASWLADDYKLNPSEIAQVLGTAAQYKVAEVADRNVNVVLKIDKERLKTLAPLQK